MRSKFKHKGRKIGLISKLMYLAAGILALLSIGLSSQITYDSMYYTEKVKGYTLETLDNDFSEGNYGSLLRKIAYNRAYGREITDDEQDYYTFGDFYESIIDYNVSLQNGDTEQAQNSLKLSDEYLSQFRHKIFKEKALELKESLCIK